MSSKMPGKYSTNRCLEAKSFGNLEVTVLGIRIKTPRLNWRQCMVILIVRRFRLEIYGVQRTSKATRNGCMDKSHDSERTVRRCNGEREQVLVFGL